MKNLLISLISLSVLLLSVTAQFPTLSPSYSLEGTISLNFNLGATFVGPYSESVDITRGLAIMDYAVTSNTGVVLNVITLVSVNDNATYFSVNNVCNQTVFDPNILFPLNTNVWDLYAAGTESPPGTFTFTQDGNTHTVTIVNGVPASLTLMIGTTVQIIVVTNFNNLAPPFSTFLLPSECSQFTCSEGAPETHSCGHNHSNQCKSVE